MKDRKNYQSRPLEVPVVCYLNGSCSDPENWIIGKTVEVSPNGLRIRCKCSCMLEPDAELGLLILDPERQKDMQQDAPACIRARVCKVDNSSQIFEVRYLE